MTYWRGNKYRNVQKTIDGRTYHSTLEANYAQYLELLKRGKEIQDWKPQPVFRLDVNGHHICKIIPDFLVITKHGAEEIHETKCWATQTPEFRIKKKLFEALYPQYKFVVIMKGDFYC